MGQYKVYAIFEGVRTNIKYIGYTSKSITVRLGQHIERCSLLKSKKDRWLSSSLNDGTPIGIVELGSFDSVEEALLSEIHQISEHTKTHKLVNSSGGGEAGRNSIGTKRVKRTYPLRPSIGVPIGEFYTVKMDYIDDVRGVMPIKSKYITEAVAYKVGCAADVVESYWELTGLTEDVRNRFAVAEAIEYLITTNSHVCSSAITRLTGLSLVDVSSELTNLFSAYEG